MKRKKVIEFIFIFLIIQFYPLVFKAQSTGEKMNVVFIVADDLGWTGLSGHGSDLHETPNIDSLADEGIKFTNVYSAAAICSPTRASIMTGKYPARLT